MDKMSKSSSSFMNRALFMIIRDYSWIIALIQGAQTRPRVLYSEITFYFTWFLYWISSEVNNHRVGASYKGQVSPYFEAEWPLGLCIIKILRLARFTFDIFSWYLVISRQKLCVVKLFQFLNMVWDVLSTLWNFSRNVTCCEMTKHLFLCVSKGCT